MGVTATLQELGEWTLSHFTGCRRSPKKFCLNARDLGLIYSLGASKAFNRYPKTTLLAYFHVFFVGNHQRAYH